MSTESVRVVSVDGGLANLGWVVARVWARGDVLPLAAGVERTAPAKTGKVPGASAQLGTSVSYLTSTRALELARALRGAWGEHLWHGMEEPVVLALEAFSAPKGGASAGVKVGFGLGVAIATAQAIAGPGAPVTLAQATPEEVKRVMGVGPGLGDKASKDAVAAGVLRHLPTLRHLLAARGVAPGRQEHAYDAGGVLLACIDKDRFSAVMGMRT